jgi:hypothetical protein
LALSLAFSYTFACALDPGKLRPAGGIDFLDMLQKFTATDLCPDCLVIRTTRSRHCAICNVCVERFDHHCPWINNCVGIRNHNAFLVFLISTFLFTLFTVAIVIESKFFKPNNSGIVQGFYYDEDKYNREDHPLEFLCFFELCHNKVLWYITQASILLAAILFIAPVR